MTNNAMLMQGRNPMPSPESVHPMRYDVREYDDHFKLDLEVPGFAKEEIKIELKNGCMNIRAEHGKVEESGKMLRNERYFGPYGRSFNLGDEIDVNSISAAYENGILSISLKKLNKEELKKNTQIEIQ